MGHRTNYAILERDRLRLFYSHWGALSVPEDLFWGPDHARAFIEDEEEVDPGRWLNEIWCEGGAAMNFNTSELVLFGCQGVGDYVETLDAYIELINAVWAPHGWSVRWAADGIFDLAACVGVEPEHVEAAANLSPAELDALAEQTRSARGNICLILTREADGSWAQRAAFGSAQELLAAGEALLGALDGLPAVEGIVGLREANNVPMSYAPDDVIAIDAAAKVIRFVDETAPLRSELRELRALWPDWSLEFEGAGLTAFYDELGASLPTEIERLCEAEQEIVAAPMSRDQALASVVERLLNSEFGDPAEFIRQMVADYEARGERIEAHPAALCSPAHPVLDDEARQQIVAAALARCLASD
jgi:hypothetical protein